MLEDPFKVLEAGLLDKQILSSMKKLFLKYLIMFGSQTEYTQSYCFLELKTKNS